MSKISGYANSVSSLGTDDLLDVSEKISSSPDVYESRKMTGAILAAFIQAYAQNILANDGLTMPANRSHDLQNFVLTLQNAGFAIEGAQTITAGAAGSVDILNIYDNAASLLHRFNSTFISLFGGGVPAGSEKLLIADKTKITDRLELSGTTDGFLMPRLTTAQMNAIAAPTTNLLIFNTDLEAMYRYNGAAWVALSAGYGIVSINSSIGIPTFYASLTSAFAAASSGDTVFLHSDITETGAVTLTIPSGVNFNLNGFTYTLDGQGIDAIVYNGTSTKTSITNGKIVHVNASSLGSALSINGSPDLVDCTGLVVVGDGLRCLSFNINTGSRKDSVLTGGSFIYNGVLTNSVQYVEGTARGSFFNPADGYVFVFGGIDSCYIKGGVYGNSDTLITNCRIENDTTQIGIYINGSNSDLSVISNTYVLSEISDAINVVNKVTVSNCFAESNGGYGIYSDNCKLRNCYGKSSSTYGVFIRDANGIAYDCTGESSASAGFCTAGITAILVRCSGVSTLNTSSGHGFYNSGSGDPVLIDCFSKVVNTSAYGIQGSQSTDAEILRLSGQGMTTLIGTNITNTMSNSFDTYQNIIIG